MSKKERIIFTIKLQILSDDIILRAYFVCLFNFKYIFMI